MAVCAGLIYVYAILLAGDHFCVGPGISLKNQIGLPKPTGVTPFFRCKSFESRKCSERQLAASTKITSGREPEQTRENLAWPLFYYCCLN